MIVPPEMKYLKGFGARFRTLFFAFSLLSSSHFLTQNLYANTAPKHDYLTALKRLAQEKKLAENDYWLTLGHYQKKWGKWVSLIDDPGFFFAANGKQDPQAELEATLEAFFLLPQPDREPARCRFIARYHWLKESLDIDESRLPPAECTEYDAMLRQLQPQEVILIYPAAYMNNPASMFGHTLLNIKSAEQSDLLSQSVNYAARTTVKNGLIFAIKGIFGFYPGYYEYYPYFARIQLYNDINQRDIWEYELNLNPDEVERLIWHIWELREIFSDYYFFDENCSYNLLYLLEAARPGMNLIDHFPIYAIPLDTVRAVKQSGVVKAINYRPSKATKIRHLQSLLTESQETLAYDIATLKLSPHILVNPELPPDRLADIHDLATEYLQYRYMQQEITQDVYRKVFLNLLKQRSLLPETRPASDTLPSPAEPTQGHRSKRMSLGASLNDNRWGVTLQPRPVYHDLLDPESGYQHGSGIAFFDPYLEYDWNDEKLRLKQLDLITIIDLSPRDRFFRPRSWKVTVGFIEEKFAGDKHHQLFRVDSGQGIARKINDQCLVFGLADIEFLAARVLHPDYSLGIGIHAGILAKFTERWNILLSGRGLTYQLGDRNDLIRIECEQRWQINANRAWYLKLARQKNFSLYQTMLSAGINLYF